MDNAGIVRANVSKLRAARYLADRPNAGCSRCQALVYFDVTAIGELYAGFLESDVFDVRRTSGSENALEMLRASITARGITHTPAHGAQIDGRRSRR